MTARAGAILGFGHVAALGHFPAWRARPDARIVAVADVDPARRVLAHTLLPDARVYDNARALLARERLDFVDVATPPAGHAALILQALRAGCDVLCEKPLVTTLADFQRVARAARRMNLALVTVHNWKHSPHFDQVMDLVAFGAIGWPTGIGLLTERQGHAAGATASWRRDAAQAGGGILFDHGWHALYLTLALASERPVRLRAVTERRLPDPGGVEDTVRCQIEFPSSTAEIALTWAAEHRRTRWTVAGTTGSLDLAEDRLQVRTGDHTREVQFADSISASSHHPDWFDAAIDDFFRAIDDPTERYANLAEAEWCLTLITLAYRSAATGQPMPIPANLPPFSWRTRSARGRAKPTESAAPSAPQR